MTDTAAFTDLYRRGQQAIAQEDGGAATAAFQALVKLAPALPLARLAAASCAVLTGDLATAEKHAGWLLGYAPGREVGAQALSLLGIIAFQRGDVELALRFHEAAAAAGADQAAAQANRVACLLALGRWREAWPLLAPPQALRALARFSGVPMWRDDGPPSHIDIHMDYMGAGDCIALVRFVPLIARRNHHVTLEVPRALVSLLARSFQGVTVTNRANVLPTFQLPLTFAPACTRGRARHAAPRAISRGRSVPCRALPEAATARTLSACVGRAVPATTASMREGSCARGR